MGFKRFSNGGTTEETVPAMGEFAKRPSIRNNTWRCVFMNEKQMYGPGVWTTIPESENMVLTRPNNTIRAMWWMARPFSSS